MPPALKSGEFDRALTASAWTVQAISYAVNEKASKLSVAAYLPFTKATSTSVVTSHSRRNIHRTFTFLLLQV